jgi:predicted transposase/invertase (TIGR01784 family)
MRAMEILMETATSDLLFKLIFGNERNKKLLLHLLNSIVISEKKITDVDIRKTELTPEYLGGKEVRLDVVAKTSDSRLINIEVQKCDEGNMVERSLFY